MGHLFDLHISFFRYGQNHLIRQNCYFLRMLVSETRVIKGSLLVAFHDYHLSEDIRMLVAECFEADIEIVEESGKSCRSV